MNFAVSDRVAVNYTAKGELAQAIGEHRDYVMHETLCVALADALDESAAIETEIDGQALRFTVTRRDN